MDNDIEFLQCCCEHLQYMAFWLAGCVMVSTLLVSGSNFVRRQNSMHIAHHKTIVLGPYQSPAQHIVDSGWTLLFLDTCSRGMPAARFNNQKLLTLEYLPNRHLWTPSYLVNLNIYIYIIFYIYIYNVYKPESKFASQRSQSHWNHQPQLHPMLIPDIKQPLEFWPRELLIHTHMYSSRHFQGHCTLTRTILSIFVGNINIYI